MTVEKEKIRVLIADDSFLIRKIVAEMLSESEHIEIVGEAHDGLQALEKSQILLPDVITMDYNMPVMNGAEAVKTIMAKIHPAPSIIMVSANTTAGAEETFRCLNLGAIDFVAKPSGEVSLDISKLREELVIKIEVAYEVRKKKIGSKKPYDRVHERHDFGARDFELIVIGASPGGPPAIEEILTALPADFCAPVLIVQHMPKEFTKSFADRLDKISRIRVKEAEEGDEILAGRCLIAPGDWHMTVKAIGARKIVALDQGASMNGFRPSIDRTMISAAEVYGQKIVGVILTGMGYDGANGLLAIKQAGGITFAQDPETAVVGSMPSAAIEKKCVDKIFTLKHIAAEISACRTE